MKQLSLISRIVLVLPVFLMGFALSSCSEKPNHKMAFSSDSGIILTKVASFETEPSGMTGDKQTFIVFNTKATEKNLYEATSASSTRTDLSWHEGKTGQLVEILQYFEAYETYRKILPRITNILDAPDLRYSCVELHVSKRGVEYASIWVCSPSCHELAYLSGF